MTEITQLDRVGIPVFAGIRPYADPRTLCVHAGKGARAIEAKVGAYMESIEFAIADQRRHVHRVHLKTIQELLESFPDDVSFPMFCPRFGTQVQASDTIPCVEGIDHFSKQKVWVPAELVFHPFAQEGTRSLFDGSTNGLCSGNSLNEAIVHGICEVLERDVMSFDLVDDHSTLCSLDGAPPVVQDLQDCILAAGLHLAVRQSSNCYGLPFVSAYVLEPSDTAPIAIADGFGLHPFAQVATVRAISEAAQSRLTHIHGGRDDIVERVEFFRRKGREQEVEANRLLRAKVMDATRRSAYGDLPDHSARVASIDDALALLKSAMFAQGMRSCVSVVLSDVDLPFVVARVIVPGAEFFDPPRRRVGPRLLQAFQASRGKVHGTGGDLRVSEW